MKYDITFSCGHEGTINLSGPHKDRERKIEYLQQNGSCSECYKKQLREKEKATGLELSVSLALFSIEKPVLLIFEGDSITYKEEIKALEGYRYDYIANEGFANLFSMPEPRKKWHKYVKLEDADKEIDAAKSIGAKIKDNINAMDMRILEENLKEKSKIDQQIAELPKPKKPSILEKKHWNGKIYGTGLKYIYLDQDKVDITKEEAKKLSEYFTEKQIYDEEVSLIQEGRMEKLKEEREKRARIKAMNDEIDKLKIPKKPQFLEKKYWNGKIYEKKNIKSIYLDQERTKLTEAEAEELSKYIKDKEIYKNEVKRIKDSFK